MLLEITVMSTYSWPNYRGNVYHTGLSLVSGPVKPYVYFKFQTTGAIISSPAVDSNGNIYFGTSGDGFYKLSSNGTELWQYPSTNNFIASPALNRKETLVYVGDNTGFDVFALFTATGKIKWTTFVGVGVTSSPYYYEPSNGGRDQVFVALSSGDIRVFDANTGDILSSFSPGIGSIVYSSPIVFNGVVFVGVSSAFSFIGLNISVPTSGILSCLQLALSIR